MGADLYIQTVFDMNYEKYESLFNKWIKRRDELQREDKVEEAMKAQEKASEFYDLMYSEGYFRDSYNSSNLLWQFGLDYWVTVVNLTFPVGAYHATPLRLHFYRC